MKTSDLTESHIKCMSPADRKALGLRTKAETLARGIVKAERDLQRQIASLLGLHGIVYVWHRTDKKSTATIGIPDFLLCVRMGVLTVGCAWECKLPSGELSPEQVRIRQRMTTHPNGWRYRIIHSIDEAIQELKELEVM